MMEEDKCLTCLHADITYGDRCAVIYCLLKERETYAQQECPEFTPIVGVEKGEGDGTEV